MNQKLKDISASLGKDEFGNYVDSQGRMVNEYGQLIDEFGELLEDSDGEGFAVDEVSGSEEVKETIRSVEPPTHPIKEAAEDTRALHDVVFNIPLSNIKELCELPGTAQISVHGILLTVDVSKFQEQFGSSICNINSMKVVSAALEERLTPEDVLELRNTQILAINSGAAYKIEEGELVRDIESFKVVIPDLVSKIKIELADVEIPSENLQVLNSIRPEFSDRARGLKKILKTGAAVEILNAIQSAGYDTELDFYMTLLTKMDKGSPTVKMALAHLRLLMQYALNVDNLELKAVLTEVFVNGR